MKGIIMRGKYKEKQITRYFSFSNYLINTFGEKVYKLCFDAGMTCPNRDGKISYGGCIFCSEGGSGDFAVKLEGDISLAVERAKRLVSDKGANKFIAYFQSYTNTYAPIEQLEKIFLPIIKRDDIVALSIATRPDCLPNDVIELISKLCKIKPVFVELGLQTIHENTAKFIRRGYQTPIFDSAVKKLNAVGANVVAHLILGLPGESEEMILQSVKHIANSKIHGVKLQLLHILKNTDLALFYQENNFKVLSQEEYVSLLAKCVELLPSDMVIHRFTGDAPKKLLIQPLWSANKKAVLNAITKYFSNNNVIQGKNHLKG